MTVRIAANMNSWDTELFISSYINIPLIFILYFVYKFIKKTKIVPLDKIPIRHFLAIAAANPEPLPKKKSGWKKWAGILWS